MKARELRKLKKLIPSSLMRRLKRQCNRGISLEIQRRNGTDKDMEENILDAFKNIKRAVRELEDALDDEYNSRD